ncbi:hypothetical protein RJT34_17026 [Clitoria ternatea]|uniref:Uncharacterized protein n=1 Tax=Clitoria ternatea TaxID=43366 RepID=A0AAN9J8J1_CLITE
MRYTKKINLEEGEGHKAGFATVIVLLICVAYTSTYEIVHVVQKCHKEKWNGVQATKDAKITNGAFVRTDKGLKGNSFDVHFPDPCKEYLNVTKACSNISKGVEGVGEQNGLYEHNVEKHGGNYSEAKITSRNGLVGMIENIENKQDEVPSIKLVDIEKHM